MNAIQYIDSLFEIDGRPSALFTEAVHTPGYYWKQTHGYPVKIGENPLAFEMYRLIGPKDFSKPFESYESMADYCERLKINPAQA